MFQFPCIVAAKFVRKLDYRYTKEQKAKRLKCKARTDGALSQLSPMEGPAWAIDASYRKENSETPLPEHQSPEEDNDRSGVEEDDISEDSDIFDEN